jgi:uncharacterized protein
MLSQIYRYPIKSSAAQVLQQALVTPLGLEHDRRWMLVDANTGRFITGRELGRLVQMQVEPIEPGELTVSAPGLQRTVVKATGDRMRVTVWDSEVDAICADDVASLALSQWLGQSVKLVYFDAQSSRPLDAKSRRPGDTADKHAHADDQTAFADGYPILIVSESSLALLNTRAAEPIHMLRFRTNLVVSGDFPAHTEDSWRRIRIGQVEFEMVKPCVRCVFTTVDHQTGERSALAEPLTALKEYRRSPKGITFGMNAILRGAPGIIRVGDALEIL